MWDESSPISISSGLYGTEGVPRSTLPRRLYRRRITAVITTKAVKQARPIEQPRILLRRRLEDPLSCDDHGGNGVVLDPNVDELDLGDLGMVRTICG